MRTWICVAASASLFAPATSPAQNKAEAQVAALVSRSPDSLEPLFKVTGDSLDPVVTISSYGVTAIVNKGLLASTTNEDSFLRAFINKKTGVVTAQVYHLVRYGGRGFDSFQRATYDNGAGIQEASVSEAGHDVSCGRYGCVHYQDLIFPVDTDALRKVAKEWSASDPYHPSLRYRIFGQSGTNYDSVIPANEIAAFVRVVDRERAKYLPEKR